MVSKNSLYCDALNVCPCWDYTED